MKKISSNWTTFNKKIFPAFWFGFLSIFGILAIATMVKTGEIQIMFIIIPVFMAIFGYFIMRLLIFDLMDEAWYGGDFLLFKNKGIEERVALSNVMNVSYMTMSNPPRVTLTLRNPGRLGKEITFSPPLSLIPFKKDKMVTELIERIDRDRNS